VTLAKARGLVDSHCHLDDEKFDSDRAETIARAQAAGVERMMTIGETGLPLAEQYPFIYAAVGVHPHEASSATPEIFDRLRTLASHPKVLAIGEIGLDYHYDFSPRDVQRSVFERHLEIAAAARKPIVIHTREAWEDTMSILSQWGSAMRCPVILHCFTGAPTQAEEALSRGYYLAFGGVLTFPKSDAVRESARLTPDDRLLIETDCPYLAPVPHRGKRNEPAFVVEVARRLAEVRGTTPEQIAELTTVNFTRLCSPNP
jgi:TatD DNase family protein